MLIEDISLGAFPVPGYGKNKYEVRLDPPDSDVKKLITDALETQYHSRDLTGAIYEFGSSCCRVLTVYGIAPYEIVHSAKSAGKFKPFFFSLIPPSSFRVTKNRFQQHVPREVAEERGFETQIIDFEKDEILLFELPLNLRSHHEQMMESLAFLGENIFPKFVLKDLFNTKVPFSRDEYLLNREIAINKATQAIGWNARDYGTEYRFEHYVWQRQLVFHRFLCVLRESVLKRLNEGLKRVGTAMGFKAELNLEGLPSVADADAALQNMREGNGKTFIEIMKPF